MLSDIYQQKHNIMDNNKILQSFSAVVLLLIAGSTCLWGQEQVWTYDFNVDPDTHSSGESTAFFPSSPADGGIYRIRIGNAGGELELDGDKAIMIAATSTSANKVGVYGWDSPTSAAYVKFELKTSSTDNGRIAIALGNDDLVTNNQNYSGNYNQSLTSFWINYSSGDISSVQRRDGGSNTNISSHGFVTDTEKIVEIYGNNSNAVALYERNGVTYNLDPQSWDLWVAGSKISSDDGWGVAGNLSANDDLSGFVFFGESSNDNVATITLDDYEYANHLPQPEIADPILFASPASIDKLSYLENAGPSEAKSFEVSGENLENSDVTVTAPTHFQVSTEQNSGFDAAVTLPSYDGTATDIWVRLAGGLDVGEYSGNVGISGGGAAAINITVSGRVVEEFDIPYANAFKTGNDIELAEIQGFELEDSEWGGTGGGGFLKVFIDGFVESPTIDFTQFDYLLVSYDLETFGGGSDREFSLMLTVNDGEAYETIQTDVVPGDYSTFSEIIDLTGDYNVSEGKLKFKMTNGTAGQTRFRDLTIDEPVSVADIADLRTGVTDGTIYILTGDAVVNFAQSFKNQKWIQDENAAILIDDSDNSIIGGEERFGKGDGITDIVGTLNTFNNTLQIIPIADATGPFEAAFAIEPTMITMDQFLNNFSDFESQLVTIENVSFSDADDAATFSNGDVQEISDGVDEGAFRATFHGVDYNGSVIPETTLNITGILNERTSDPEGQFITSRNWADFAFLTEEDGYWPDLAEEAASFVINHNITLNGDATVANLTISNDKSLTISPAGTLTVTGTLTNENNGVKNGTGLLIQSTASGTGTLIHNTPGVQATAERYIEEANDWSASPAVDWHFIASPVANQDIDGDWTPTVGEQNYDFFAWGEETGEWLNQKVDDNNIDEFIPGQGYLVAYKQTATNIFSGELNAGTVNFTLSNSGNAKDDWYGWNLLGNPYPSAINWGQVNHDTYFEDDYAYVWNREKDGAPGYETIDGEETEAYIAANQGFFVLAKPDQDAEFFTFNNDIRTHGPEFMKNNDTNPERLVVRLGTDAYYDETTIRIEAGTDFTRDRRDALKLMSFAVYVPQVYTYTEDNVNVAINSIPKIDKEQPITLGMRIPEDGEYTLSLQEVSGAFESNTLLLEDAHKDIFHDLHEQPMYSFEAEQGDISDRFTLHFSPPDDDDDTTNIPDTDAPEARIWHHDNTLFIDNPGDQAEIRLYDITGRLMQTLNADTGQHSHELNLPAGAYIIQSNHQDIEPMKIIIQ